MAWNNGMKSCTKLLMSSEAILQKSAKRGLHSTGVKRMGGHGHDAPYYEHAKHMYNLDKMKNQKLKVTLGTWTVVAIGMGVPVFAVLYQQKKRVSV
ncbi:hypothetical protein RGQ29_008701 [Quercus rubra]|uniref:SLL1 protein n=1 Tax=Quercus rubra TaxID=3512 RepID=A0AAN7HYZ0_QUERU|nr:hypothetical protein RGQ29_008701 [Quercus rubra]